MWYYLNLTFCFFLQCSFCSQTGSSCGCWDGHQLSAPDSYLLLSNPMEREARLPIFLNFRWLLPLTWLGSCQETLRTTTTKHSEQIIFQRKIQCYYQNKRGWPFLSINWGNELESIISLGFSGGASGKESACQCRKHKRCGFDPWVRKFPWRRKWQTTLVFLPGKFHGQSSLQSMGHKESDMSEHTYTQFTHLQDGQWFHLWWTF